METNEKPRICDVVNYEQDIEPFSLIKIYSGVGSGKFFYRVDDNRISRIMLHFLCLFALFF